MDSDKPACPAPNTAESKAAEAFCPRVKQAVPDAVSPYGYVDLRLVLPPQVILLLDELSASGLYGGSKQEVAERLICERLRDIQEGNTAIGNMVTAALQELVNKIGESNAPMVPAVAIPAPAGGCDCHSRPQIAQDPAPFGPGPKLVK